MCDLWDAVGAVLESGNRSEAERVRDRMLKSDLRRLSTRDSRELFNELLRLEEKFNGLIGERADLVLEMIKNDVWRQNYRQDPISKAHLLYMLSDHAGVPLLLSILHDRRQDLDARILWRRDGVSDACAVLGVRDLVHELMPLARNREEPACSFVVGLCYLLLSYRRRIFEDEFLAREVYEMNVRIKEKPRRSLVPSEDEEMMSWFRTQFTCDGLIPDAVKRGYTQ